MLYPKNFDLPGSNVLNLNGSLLPSKPNILSPEKPGLYPVRNSVAMLVGTPATLYKSDNIPLPANPTSLKTLPNCVSVN